MKKDPQKKPLYIYGEAHQNKLIRPFSGRAHDIKRRLVQVFVTVLFLAAAYPLSLRLFSSVYHRISIALIQNGSFEEALRPLEKALRLCPNNADLWKTLGNAYDSMSRLNLLGRTFLYCRQAEKAYRRAADLTPMDAESFYRLASATAQLEMLDLYVNPGGSGQSYNVLPYFLEAVRLRPNGILYRYALVRYLYRTGKDAALRSAVAGLTRAYPPAYANLKKETFWSPKLREAAIKGMKEAIRTKSMSESAHMSLSILLEDEGDWAGAISHYQKALSYERGEKSPAQLYHLARLNFENGRSDAAEELFAAGLSASAQQKNDLENLYRYYGRKNCLQKFIHLLTALRNRSVSSDAVGMALAGALTDLKNYSEARQVLADLNHRRPTGEAYYRLFRIAEMKNDWSAMELAIQKATVYDPGNTQYHLLFSHVLSRRGKVRQAEKAADQAVRFSPQPSASLFHHRAGLRLQLGDFLGAAEDWEQAGRLSPQEAAFHVLAAEAFESAGRTERAIHHYRQAAALSPGDETYRKKVEELQNPGKGS